MTVAAVTFMCVKHDRVLRYSPEDSDSFLTPAPGKVTHFDDGDECEAFTFDLSDCWCPGDVTDNKGTDREWESGHDCGDFWRVIIVTASEAKSKE